MFQMIINVKKCLCHCSSNVLYLTESFAVELVSVLKLAQMCLKALIASLEINVYVYCDSL
jgi:hypothetical protein